MIKSPLLDLPALERFIRTITARANLRPQFKDGCEVPHTDGRGNIILPPMKFYQTQKSNLRIRADVLHECLHHIKGPEVFPLMEEHKIDATKSPLGVMLNIAEDYRIEREGVKDYRGDAHVLRESWTNYIGGVTKFLKKKSEKADARMGAVLKSVCEARQDWESNPNARDFYKQCPKEMEEMYAKMEAAGMHERLKKLDSVADSFQYAKDLYELLFEKSAEEELKRLKKEAEKEGKGKPKPGKPGDKEGKGKAASGRSGKGDGEEVDGVSNLQIYMPSNDIDDEEHEAGPRGDQHVDYSEYDKGSGYADYDPCPLEDMKVTWFRRGERVGGSRSGHSLRLPNDASPGFITRVKRELQIKSAAQYIPNQKRGKLHSKSLWKVPLPMVGDGEWNRQVFRKRIESDILDCAVLVLTDWSGSMGGEKCVHAAMSAVLLNDAMSRGLHIPTSILAFSERGPVTAIGVVKEFDEAVNKEKIVERFQDCFGFMTANSDGDAIMWAFAHIAPRKEKRKLIIVLSDGSPAGHRGGDLPAYTKRVIGDIEKSKFVDIYGIGICDDNVKRLYKRNRVIHSADELEQAVIEVVREKILS